MKTNDCQSKKDCVRNICTYYLLKYLSQKVNFLVFVIRVLSILITNNKKPWAIREDLIC